MQLSPVTSLPAFKPTLQRPLANPSAIAPPPSTQREGVQVFTATGILKSKESAYLKKLFDKVLKRIIELENQYGGQFAIVVHQNGERINKIQLNYFSNWTEQYIKRMPSLIEDLSNWEEIKAGGTPKAYKQMDTTLLNAINNLIQKFGTRKADPVASVNVQTPIKRRSKRRKR